MGNKNSGNKTTYKKVYSGQRFKDYLKICKDDFEKQIVQQNEEKGYVMYKSVLKVKLPTIEGYAKFLKKAPSTLEDWGRLYPEFRVAMDTIIAEQKQRLLECGLEGTYNSTIAKLILSSNHNMREKSDITSGDEPLNTFSDDQVDKIADRIARRKENAGNTSSEKKSN